MAYSDGTAYEGNWVHGKYHGEGVLTDAQGFSYVGAWKQGLRHGEGI